MGNSKDRSPITPAEELRRLAEAKLKEKSVGLLLPRTKAEMQRLFHELEVHQIELEMQNEELRQARNEIEKALEKYTDLYDFAPVGYFTLEHDGKIGAVNLSGANLLGMERSRLLGRRFELFVSQEARPFFSEFIKRVFASHGKQSCEMPLTVKDNRQLFVQIEASGYKLDMGCRLAVIDITRRRSAEDLLSEKRRELEELNKSLEKRIVQAVDDLRSKDQMMIIQDRRAVMGEMISNIAHQWRQPLNTLGLVVQQAPLFYDSSEFSREFLETNTAKAMELIQHMSQTIDDFRNFFRADKEMVTFGVNQVIEKVISFVEKSFMDQQISIVFEAKGDPEVNGYPNEYSQVMLNILMNARDALVNHDFAGATISILSFAEGDKTVVTIGDNAGGIADEILDKIFDPYFTTKGPDKGTGIGLFMSKTIIEKNMGGSLTVQNTGNGAEFRIETGGRNSKSTQ